MDSCGAELLTFLRGPKEEVHEVLRSLLLEEALGREPASHQSCAAHQDDARAWPVGSLVLAERLRKDQALSESSQ